MDLNGTLKHMPVDGDLYSDPIQNEDAFDDIWDPAALEIMRKEKIQKPLYQQDLDATTTLSSTNKSCNPDYNFSETVETWTDFMYSRYHPRSINIINDVHHSPSEHSFDCFTSGTELWKTDYFQEDYCDKIRQYIEECSSCQVIKSGVILCTCIV